MNSLAIVAAVIAIIVIVGGVYYLSTQNMNATATTSTPAAGTSGSTTPPTQAAKTTWTVSDAPAASSVSAVNVQVKSIQVRSSTSGQWYPVAFSTNGNYNISALHGYGSYAIMGNATVPVGTYNWVMVTLGNVTATVNGTTKTVVLANSTFTVPGSFTFTNTAGTSSTNWVNIGINSSESLHAAANGKWVMYPTVQLILWQNAELGVQSNNWISVQNYGTVTATVNSGMTLNGTMQPNFVLPQTLNLTVGLDGRIGLGTL